MIQPFKFFARVGKNLTRKQMLIAAIVLIITSLGGMVL
jgi:hypothetical protein